MFHCILRLKAVLRAAPVTKLCLGGLLTLGFNAFEARADDDSNLIYEHQSLSHFWQNSNPSRASAIQLGDTVYVAYNKEDDQLFHTYHYPNIAWFDIETEDNSTTNFKISGGNHLGGSNPLGISNKIDKTRTNNAITLINNTLFQFWFNVSMSNGGIIKITPDEDGPIPSEIAYFNHNHDSNGILDGYYGNNTVDLAVASFQFASYLFIPRWDSSNDKTDIRVLASDGSEKNTTIVYEQADSKDLVNGSNRITSLDATEVVLEDGNQAAVVVTSRKDYISYDDSSLIDVRLWDPLKKQFVWQHPIDLGDRNELGYGDTMSVRVAPGPVGFKDADISGNGITIFLYTGSNELKSNIDIYFLPLPKTLPSSVNTDFRTSVEATYLGTQDNYTSSEQMSANPTNSTVLSVTVPANTQEAESAYADMLQSNVYFYIDYYSGYSETFCYPSLYYQTTGSEPLTLDSSADIPSAKDVGLDDDPDKYEEFQRGIAQYWTLLGIVTGLPPIPADDASGTSNIIEITYSTSSSNGASTGNTDSFSIQAGFQNVTDGSPWKGSGIGANYSYSSDRTFDETKSFTLEYTYEFGSDTTVGWMVIEQPTINRGDFDLYFWDKTTSTGITALPKMWFSNTLVTTIPFNLKDPTTPIQDDPNYPSFIFNFPAILEDDDGNKTSIQWPDTSDIHAWKTYIGPIDGTEVSNILKNVSDSSLQTTDSSGKNMTIHGDTIDTKTHSYTNSAGGNETVDYKIFKSSSSYSHSWTKSVKTTFDTSTGITFNYPALTSDNETYTNITTLVYLYYLEKTNPEKLVAWIPEFFQNGARPWFLTWQVNNTVPSTDGSGAYGNNAFLGNYYVDTESPDSGWIYAPSIAQWAFNSETRHWYFFDQLKSWVYIPSHSTPEHILFYNNTTGHWNFTEEFFYPWSYDFTTQAWIYN